MCKNATSHYGDIPLKKVSCLSRQAFNCVQLDIMPGGRLAQTSTVTCLGSGCFMSMNQHRTLLRIDIPASQFVLENCVRIHPKRGPKSRRDAKFILRQRVFVQYGMQEPVLKQSINFDNLNQHYSVLKK